MIKYDGATSEMYAFFWEAWKLGAPPIVGYLPEIRWMGVPFRELPPSSQFWARASIQTMGTQQATLSTCEGAPYQRKYNTYGLVVIQVFCPRSDTQAAEKGRQLAMVAQEAFQGRATENKIWFRKVRITELPPEELYERFNIIGEFNYDTIK